MIQARRKPFEAGEQILNTIRIGYAIPLAIKIISCSHLPHHCFARALLVEPL